MKDDAYSLELLPATLKRLTFTAANAIEENLQYLILLFPYFSGKIRASPIGSYGYLELTETGCAGDGFDIESAIRINKIKITVSGADLSALTFQGAGWSTESSAPGSLALAYTSNEFMPPAKIQEILNGLRFAASADLDSEIVLQVSNTEEGAGGAGADGVPRWGNVGARRGKGADVGRCRGGGHGLERL